MILANTMSLNKHIGQDICLQCRLSQQESLVSQYGKPYFRLKLEDSYGKSYGLIWPNNELYQHLHSLDPRQLPPIEVSGRVAQLNHYIYIKVAELSLMTDQHVVNGAQVLPKMLVPFLAHEAHAWLVNFISTLLSDALRTFMTSMLLDRHVLQVASQVRRHGCVHNEASQRAGGRESATEEDVCRRATQSRDPAGGT